MKSRIPFLGLVFVTVLACPSIASAASVKVTVGSVDAKKKQDVAVPITLTGAAGLGAIEFELTYDAAVVGAAKIDKGPLASNTMLESSVAKSGRVRIAVVSSGGISGDGVLATVHFTAGEGTGRTSLGLENVRAWIVPQGHEGMAGMQHLIDAQVVSEPGAINVSSGTPVWMMFSGSFIALFVAIIAMKKRRTSA